jgi:hypothetical protein
MAWFDDNAPQSAFTPGPGFTNTAAQPFVGPNGTPDPNNPGYDTHGYRLGSTYDPNTGRLVIPNTATGQTASSTINAANAALTSGPIFTATGSDGGGSTYPTAASLSGIYGNMPEIPNIPAFDFAPFAPPSAQDVLQNDPGYQFRLGQGLQAVQQSAAARGVLNTGGTLKDIADYGQNYASGEYGNAFNRALSGYQTNFADALQRYNANLQTQYVMPYTANWQQYLQAGNNFNTNVGQQIAAAQL